MPNQPRPRPHRRPAQHQPILLFPLLLLLARLTETYPTTITTSLSAPQLMQQHETRSADPCPCTTPQSSVLPDPLTKRGYSWITYRGPRLDSAQLSEWAMQNPKPCTCLTCMPDLAVPGYKPGDEFKEERTFALDKRGAVACKMEGATAGSRPRPKAEEGTMSEEGTMGEEWELRLDRRGGLGGEFGDLWEFGALREKMREGADEQKATAYPKVLAMVVEAIN